MVFLVSDDGDFASMDGGSTYRTAKGKTLNGNEAVIQWLRDNNRHKDIVVNTVLTYSKGSKAMETMGTIASENGGQLRLLAVDSK